MNNELDKLNPGETELLNEFVEIAKNPTVHVPEPQKRMVYDFTHGRGEAIELLNKYFYQLVEKAGLSLAELRGLAKSVLQRERRWVVEREGVDGNRDRVQYDES